MEKGAVAKARERKPESTADVLREAENRQLAQDRDDPASAYFTGDPRGRVDRRRFLAGSIAAAGSRRRRSRSAQAAAPLGAVEHDVPADASKVQGYPLADEELRLALAVRNRGANPVQDEHAAIVVDVHAAGKELRHHHAVGPSLRAQPRRHRGHRSDARIRCTCTGMVRQPKKFSMQRHSALSVDVAHHVSRVLGQRPDRMVEADAENRPGHARADVDVGVDRRAAFHRSSTKPACAPAPSGCWPKAATRRR